MNEAADPRDRVGLCRTCRHAHTVPTAHLTYWLCRYAAIDSRYDKYPRLPVLRCGAYVPLETPRAPGGAGRSDEPSSG
ncbi:MAG: hypothetical protein HOP12_14645 [Candidatus Eisenbacteria bacterium]|uniref:Uncharacterized protein n=1 Tax=Eiseniibacteriota bacterium TaxID=2212470 RepID=A0A849SVJ0_UNCEI|nr:hypothetical protein [Candidatus Eisenbacteria bacterium]